MRCTPSRAPRGAPISRCRWSDWTNCCRVPPGASVCPRRYGRWRRSPAISHHSGGWRSSSRRRARSSTCRWWSPSRTWASWAAHQRRPGAPVEAPTAATDRRSGPTSRSGSPTSSRPTARPSSSPTPAGWPSGCATASTRSPTSGRRAKPSPRARHRPRSWPSPGPPTALRPCSPGPTTARCPKNSAPWSKRTSRRGGSPRWWPPPVWSWASTWARSTSSSRSSRPLGRVRPSARGAGRAPSGRGLHRRGLPQVPRRPGAGGRGHRADAQRLH